MTWGEICERERCSSQQGWGPGGREEMGSLQFPLPHQALGTEWHSLEGPLERVQGPSASLKAINLMGEDKSTGPQGAWACLTVSALVLFKPSGKKKHKIGSAPRAMKPLGLDPSLEEGWRENLTTILQWD